MESPRKAEYSAATGLQLQIYGGKKDRIANRFFWNVVFLSSTEVATLPYIRFSAHFCAPWLGRSMSAWSYNDGVGAMRSILLAGVSSAALASTAWAADLPTKAPPAAIPVAPTWSGFYIGLDAGWLQNRATVDELQPDWSERSPSASVTANGFIGGGHLGYNWQYQQLVLGIEGDIGAGTGSSTTTFFGGSDTFTSRINWLSTIRGRLGVAFDQWLLYGTAGWAVAGVHNTRTDTIGPFVLDETKTRSGFIWGGGVERMFTPHWSGRIEALGVNLGDDTVTTIAGGLPYTTRFTNKALIVRGGMSYKW